MVRFSPLGHDYPERDTIEEAQADVDNGNKMIVDAGFVYRTPEGKFVGLAELSNGYNWRTMERHWVKVRCRILKGQYQNDWHDC